MARRPSLPAGRGPQQTDPPPPSRRLGTWLRRLVSGWLGAALKGLGLLLLFVVALASSLLLHLGLPGPRALVAGFTEQALDDYFRGSVSIDAIDSLGPLGLRARGLEVRDPAGQTVVTVGRLRARFNAWSTLQKVALGLGKITIVVDHVRLEDCTAQVMPFKGEALPGIAVAFEPAHPTPPSAPSQSNLRVWLPTIEVGTLRGRVKLKEAPLIETVLREARASLLVAHAGVALDVTRIGVLARGVAGVDATGVANVHIRYPGAYWGYFDGALGEVPLHVFGHLRGDEVKARLELPHVEPSAAAGLVPDWPLKAPVALSARVAGVLPDLETFAVINVGDGRLEAKGPLSVADGFDMDLDVDSHQLDLQQIDPAYPATRVDVRSAVQLWTDGSDLEAEANATVLPSTVAGLELPAIDVRANYGTEGLIAVATFHERGVPAHLDVTMPPSGAPIAVDLTVKKTVLQNSPRLSRLLGARGIVELQASAELTDGVLGGNARLSSSALQYQGLAIDRSRVDVRFDGSLSRLGELTLKTQSKNDGVRYGPLALEEVTLGARGTPQSQQVDIAALHADGTRFELGGRVTPTPLSVEGLRFAVARRGAEIDGKVNRVAYIDDQLSVAGLELNSDGRLRGDAEWSPGRAHIELRGDDVDLGRIGRALDIPRNLLSGALEVDTDVTLGSTSKGRIALGLRDASLAGLGGLNASTRVTMAGHTSSGELSGSIEGLATVAAAWNATAKGNHLRAQSWLDASGFGWLTVSEIDLAAIAAAVGERAGILDASGKGALKVSVARQDSKSFPQAQFEFSTERLAVTFVRDEASEKSRERDERREPARIDSVDVAFAGALDGQSVGVAGQIRDFRGDLATLSAQMKVNAEPLIDALRAGQAPWPLIKSAPLRAIVNIPERDIGQLPPLVRPRDLLGQASGRVVVTGTLVDPLLSMTAQVRQLGGALTQLGLPVDVEASLRYDATPGQLLGSVGMRHNATRIAWGNLDVTLPWQHLLAPPADKPLWTGKAQLLLDGAPLGVLEAAARSDSEGLIQGYLSVERLELYPKLEAQLTLRDLKFGDTELGEASVSAESRGELLVARAQFEDVFGTLAAAVQTALDPTPWAVTPRPNSPLQVSLQVNDYDAAVLAPALAGTLSELSGPLKGYLRGTLTPPPAAADGAEPAPWGASFEGQLDLKDGVIEPTALGVRLLDAQARVVAAPQGALNVVQVQNFSARAKSETPNLSGHGQVQFRGLELVDGRFELNPRAVPLSAGGSQMAELTGKVNTVLKAQGEGLLVEFEIPELLAELPDSGDNELIELQDNPDVKILQQLGPGDDSDDESAPSTPIELRAVLGDDVRVKSQLMNIKLRGETSIFLEEETRMSGAVELVSGGTVQVMGRIFRVNHGQVQFDSGEPSNPYLDVMVSWRAPNGVLVHATVRGRAKKPELLWDSNPPLAGGETAIVSLVLGTGGSEGSGDAGGAGIAAGAALVNEVLGKSGMLERVEVYATRERGGASEGQVASLSERTWDSYTAAYRVSDELYFEGSYTQESNTLDIEGRQGFSGALDWRFHRNWSLRTEVGTLGAGLDLLWQYQY